MIDIGIVGVGVAGEWYADILKRTPDACLAAALRSPSGDTDAVTRDWKAPCFNSIERFLSHGLDAVIIATPSGQHYTQAKAALERDLHVLIEKPITLEIAQAKELVTLAKTRDLRLGVTFQRRADPLFQAVTGAVSAGAIGIPTLLSITMPYYRSQAYYDSAAWRGTIAQDGGGILMNQGIHLVDLAVWLFGPVQKVSAFAAKRARRLEVEDTVSIALEFKNGALGSLSGTTATKLGVPHILEVCGSEGSLRIEGEEVERWDVPGLPRPSGGKANGGAADPRATSVQNHSRIVADFIGAIREGREPIVTGEKAISSIEVVQAVYAAAQSQTIVSLP